MTNKKKLYICGPMTGFPDSNIPAFLAAKKCCEKHDFEGILPDDMESQGPATDAIWHVYMPKDVALVLQVDGLVLLPEWERSRGAKIEIACGLMQSLKHPFQFHLYHPTTEVLEYSNSYRIAEQWYEYWDEYSRQPGLAA